MAFPTNPTVGDSYTQHGETWIFNGQLWTSGEIQVQSNGRLIFSDDTIPPEAPENSIWYRHDVSAIAVKVDGTWENTPGTISIGAPPAPEEPVQPEPEEPSGALFVATSGGLASTAGVFGVRENRSWTVTLTPSAGATGTTATWNWTGIQSADLDATSSFGTSISGVWTFLDDTTPMNFTFDFVDGDGAENETGVFNIVETGDAFNVYVTDG